MPAAVAGNPACNAALARPSATIQPPGTRAAGADWPVRGLGPATCAASRLLDSPRHAIRRTRADSFMGNGSVQFALPRGKRALPAGPTPGPRLVPAPARNLPPLCNMKFLAPLRPLRQVPCR